MHRGQGLLETIVAIGVIMTGLVAVMALTVSNLTTQREAAVRYQAVNLAREGLELVRNQRDSNWLAGTDTWEKVSSALPITLSPPFSQFRRTVAVGTGSTQRTVTSTVTWQQGGQPRSVELTAILYDWR